MKKSVVFAALVASFAVATSAQATQFVQNGDFSSLTNGLGQLGNTTDAPTWTIDDQPGYEFVMNVADVGSNGEYGNLSLWDAANGGTSTWNGQSPTGGNFVALDGDFQDSPLSQTITGLTAGKTYTLSFDYAFGQQLNYTGDTIQSLSATLGGNPVFTSADYNLPSEGFSGWSTYTGTVTATGTSEVLSFLAHGNLPVPPFALLTGVSLTGNSPSPIPEPATWAMMLVGLGAIGAAARRRHHTVATA